MTTGCFHFSPSFCPMILASASDAPPGVCGTMIRTALVGNSSARE